MARKNTITLSFVGRVEAKKAGASF